MGVQAATNDTVREKEHLILWLLYGAVFVMCWVSFKSWRAALCVTLPLMLVTGIGHSLMVQLDIGMKVNTLTVVALGVGIGVDYGIYIFARMREAMSHRVEFVAADTDRDHAVTPQELHALKHGHLEGGGDHPDAHIANAAHFDGLDRDADGRLTHKEFNEGQEHLRTLSESYFIALKTTGIAIFYTALTLAVGVAMWIFSDLKFQADMGVMLTFMFVVNMIAAIVFLPALCRWLLRPKEQDNWVAHL